MHLTLREVNNALAISGRGEPEPGIEMNTVVSGYSIDSRTLRPGDLFFAIRGPRFDGHDFVAAAFEQGAAGAVVAAEWVARQPKEISESARRRKQNWIVAPDTGAALQKLGGDVRRWWGGTVVAITGSAGKTTTKEICATLLGARYRVYKSEGNLNNLLGVPLTLLRVDTGAEIAVVELAMSAREEIRQLTRIARPDVGVVTNVNPVHLEFFSSVDEIALAKRELVEELTPAAFAVLNADDPRVSKFAAHTQAKVVTFGEAAGADLRVTRIRAADLSGSDFDLETIAGKTSCHLPLLGKHNIANAAAAASAALQCGLGLEEISRGLQSVHASKMRGEVLQFDVGFTVINDTYNSNPRALRELVSAMAGVPGFRRKIVVAGEMLELGPESNALHTACGQAIAEAGIDVLMTVQGSAEAMADGARSAGMDTQQVYFFNTAAEAGEQLNAMVGAGDLVLLKGSRGVRMEAALECLRRKFNPEKL